MDIRVYFIKFSLILAGFYLVWRVTSSKKTDPLFDRLFMVFSPILAGIIPLLNFSIPINYENFNILYDLTDIQTTMSSFSYENIIENPTTRFVSDFSFLLKIIFCGVSLVILSLLIRSILKKIKIISQNEVNRRDNIKIVSVGYKILPFSFINYVFLSTSGYSSLEFKAILEHEKAHINQRHYIDIIFYELLKIVLWFHPVYWLMRHKLIESHEYLADKHVLNSGVDRLEYMNTILSHSNYHLIMGLGSTFPRMITIKRFKMMKTNTKQFLLPRIIVSVSAILLFSIFLGFSYNQYSIAKTEIRIPEFTAGDDIPSIAPVDLSKVTFTSGFGMRKHPITKKEQMHKGIDLAAPLGTDVVATASGKVIEIDYNPEGAGHYIKIKHNDAYLTFYSQLSEILVKKEQKVKKGEVIGKVGSSGISTGPHLHYEVRIDGKAVDPKDYIPNLQKESK